MQIVKTRSNLSPAITALKNSGKTIGFVPTMGALHAGHISLLKQAKTENQIVVCSIFVNPRQFNDKRDLEKYPRPLQHDIAMLSEAGCDFLYTPEEGDVYSEGAEGTFRLDFEGLEHILEGLSRPGHFAGVAAVVKILLEIVQPHVLYLGQKDFQQYTILRKMVAQLHMNVVVKSCPIIREDNGLAMSSRNIRLDENMRKKAGLIYATLQYAINLLPVLSLQEIQIMAISSINKIDHFTVDYFEIRDADNLGSVSYTTRTIVIVTAVLVAGVRLLDNVVIPFSDQGR